MNFESLLHNIDQRSYAPVYFLYGAEPYFIDIISKKLEKEILNDAEKAFNQSIIYGKDADFKMIVDHARQFPMMSEKRVVILKEAQDMKSLGDLKSYVENPSPQTVLVICYKKGKYDKRTQFWKSLSKSAVVFESKKLYDNQVPGWISNYLINKGFKIDARGANLLSEYLGSDLSKVVNEIEKLIVKKQKGDSITFQDIENEVGISKDYNVFELQTALGKKDILKANRIVNYFEANPKSNPLVMVVGALFNYFSKVYLAKLHPSAGDQELSKLLSLYSSFFVKDYRFAASKYSKEKLEDIFFHLQKTDLKSKGVNNRSTTDGYLLRELVFEILH